MPTVATKTLNRLNLAGKIYTRQAEEIPYEEALRLADDPRLNVKITQREHAEFHSTNKDVVESPEDAQDQTPEAGGVPQDSAARREAILDAASKLDMDVESNFTQAGLPDARALTRELGWTVTSEERNQAFNVTKDRPSGDQEVQHRGRITISKAKKDETLDTGAAVVTEEEQTDVGDSSTDGAVEV